MRCDDHLLPRHHFWHRRTWHGIKFRTFNSPVQSETITALGAVPVNAGFEWTDEILAGRLRGAEFDVAQYAANGLTTEAGQVTADVVLWPKVPLLSLSQQRYESLTDQQQQWVRDAAKHAVQASVDATYDESTPAQQLCAQGAQFYQAGPDQTQGLAGHAWTACLAASRTHCCCWSVSDS